MKHFHLLQIPLILIFSAYPALCIGEFDVHIIYFKPTDAGNIDKVYHDTILKDIQKYLQSEMTRHGFTDKTFPLELDTDGKVVIHTVNGNHNTAHYDPENPDNNFDIFDDRVEPELPFQFNNQQNWASRDNVQLIIMGGIKLNGDWDGGEEWGFAWHGGRWGGVAFVTMDKINDFPNHYLGVVAHNLGYAFGLDPSNNDVAESFNGGVIAWGRTTAEWGDKMRIFDFEAKLLDSRPIFREEFLSVHLRKKLTTIWGKLKRQR